MARNYKELSRDDIKDILSYNPDTGVFIRTCKKYFGQLAASKRKDGRLVISINNKSYFAHRLAWLYVHGKMPDNDIDHIDGDQSNNSICNLRDVTNKENLQNRRKASHNSKTGYLGVRWEADRNKYKAQITVNGKCINIGRFDDPALAHEAYVQAKRTYHATCTI